MAWTSVEHHVFSDRWRVSSLVWAFVQLVLSFIVLLCALISIATTKLIRSSGLCLSCHSCEVDHRGKKQEEVEAAAPASQKLDLCQKRRQNSDDMSLICENCTAQLSDCSCCAAPPPAKSSSKRPPAATAQLHHHDGSPLASSSFELWPDDEDEDDVGRSSRRTASFSSADDASVRNAESCGSECRLCSLAMSGSCSGGDPNEAPMASSTSTSGAFGRPLKRKFAKVFPDNCRAGSPRDLVQGLAEEEREASSVGIGKKAPAAGGILLHLEQQQHRCQEHRLESRYEAVGATSITLSPDEIVVDDASEEEDGDQLSMMRKQFVVSDAEDADNLRKASWEESSGNSSQDSFPCVRRLPVNYGRSAEESNGNRKGEGVSGDARLQFARKGGDRERERERERGDVTPEWSGGYEASAHSFDEMGGSSVANQGDDEQMEYSGMKELKDALQAERKALADLYNELEQERSASATAANEAMAMITRLQEEKAAAQMECRQYQRMAEEKQQYDQEAIALLQDILVRRDKEMFNLEEEAKLYRQRLLSLTMDELDRANVDASGGANKKSDFLLIERETLLLEGNDDWKNPTNRKDSREERLLAEIKDWVTAANEKVSARALPAPVPAIKEEEEESAEKSQLSRKISNLSIESGRLPKNLLESFSSVGGDEESQRDGAASEAGGGMSEAGSEETAGRNEDAVGYESFHCMMDSLRKEPRLRDEASLETLNKIEKKFQIQSRKGKVRNEDDLRRIWKNTLRSFGPAAGENAANGVLNKQDSKGQIQNVSLKKSSDRSGLMSGIVRDAEANRAMEQKRISVLEYVWKFEEQLHQGGPKKPAVQLGRATSSSDINNKPEKLGSLTSDSGLDDQSGTKGALVDFSAAEPDREKSKRPSPGDGSRVPPVVSRFRRHASEGDRFHVRGEVLSSPRNEARCERPFGHEDDESSEGSLVHDVYEVQRDSLETSTPKRGETLYNEELRKSAFSTSNKQLRGESAYPLENEYMEFLGDNGDRLGKPDPLPGYSPSDREASGKGRPQSQTAPGRYVTTTLLEDEALDQDYEWPATSTSGRDQAARERTSVTPSPNKMGDVVDQLTVRLKNLEADRQTMQQTITSLRTENGEMQLLREIAQQLRELRGIDQKAMNSTEPSEPTLASAIKTGTSVSKKRRTWSLPWRSTCRTLPSSTNLSSTIHACNAGDRSNGRRYRFEWPSRGTIADSSTAAKHSADSADLADGCERESRNSTKWMGLLVASVL
ncbi:hypothetical protein MPTK1_6g15460 [Marchantia polymorpha subsp. ruderalis]|uniref:GTD-binding domain-containing protein n=2 Tax=Marchantia polymorpha TaxID=3197 RepID=A0AAF6BSC1_MARPO|nr:hypothetical protein MARPO_0056s0058 [Marchantia polymorpha]PTQ37592.1 hypothetical protein MARPO_0056s0058 [Marchantia polymorpha]BBN14905.1 hypothetical protein Mp_6g15460 [Marchantia polymorpha subsp. ruderalis]BBN14906.1 hypothetical protein Mp_6g15460 [Marchantia polymorpha subsp. ruderalis]|eukprot:PTQ37589.1 hypothetical protein MARPO_0056s0058 [Marchantia polymorpha]